MAREGNAAGFPAERPSSPREDVLPEHHVCGDEPALCRQTELRLRENGVDARHDRWVPHRHGSMEGVERGQEDAVLRSLMRQRLEVDEACPSRASRTSASSPEHAGGVRVGEIVERERELQASSADRALPSLLFQG
jgi:hypothetical protein